MKEDVESAVKHNRVLEMGIRFLAGETINKREEAQRYHVNARSIQRDLDDLRIFFAEKGMEEGTEQEIVYDRASNAYRLERDNKEVLSDGEALAVCKILLESRAFAKTEMDEIIDKIIRGCIPKKSFSKVMALIANEKFYYIEPKHKKQVIGQIRNIGHAIQEHYLLEVEYERQEKSVVKRRLKPVGILFSEYYFYLAAFIDDDGEKVKKEKQDNLLPTIYRIDRIKSMNILKEHFSVPYQDRFQEGEFRKRIQFMYDGPLQKIKLEYNGPSVEAVLDRLPTAEIVEAKDGKYIVSAEVFGLGIELWIRSQGSMIKVLEPKELADKIKADLKKELARYEEQE
jgi:predicted DNA-binding transcriptional regulator YafY